MNRRELIAGAATLGVLIAATPIATRSAAASQRFPALELLGPEIHAVVWDSRFAAARAFADDAARRGASLLETDGDLTDLWFNDLDRAWAERGAPVAGCTTAEGLFCLEQLARDRRMRVVFRAEHGPLVTWIIARPQRIDP